MNCLKDLKTGVALLLVTLLYNSCSKSTETDAPAAPINPYDGLYRLRGSFSHATATVVFEPILSNEIELRTTGQFTNAMYWSSAGDFAHPIAYNGLQTYFTSQAPVYALNMVTNAVNSITNFYSTTPGAVVYALTSGYNPPVRPGHKDYLHTVWLQWQNIY